LGAEVIFGGGKRSPKKNGPLYSPKKGNDHLYSQKKKGMAHYTCKFI